MSICYPLSETLQFDSWSGRLIFRTVFRTRTAPRHAPQRSFITIFFCFFASVYQYNFCRDPEEIILENHLSTRMFYANIFFLYFIFFYSSAINSSSHIICIAFFPCVRRKLLITPTFKHLFFFFKKVKDNCITSIKKYVSKHFGQHLKIDVRTV